MRLGVALIVSVAMLYLLSGCSPPPRSSTAESQSAEINAADRTAAAQTTVDAFVAAARRGDRAAAAAVVSSRDDGFSGRAAVWAANLARLDWSRLTWTVQSAQGALNDARQQVLGGRAWVQEVTIEWAYRGETGVSSESVWLTFVADPQSATVVAKLAGDTDDPTGVTPIPLWLQQPVRLYRSGSVLVLTNSTTADRWAAEARRAQQAVARRVAAADRDQGGVLVLEVPQSRAVFERTVGVSPGSYATVAAAAWPMGPDTTHAPIHVVVNPEAAGRLTELGRNVLLTHEAVHVAVRSPGSPTPTWLVEGYADQIAYDTWPAGREPALRSISRSVREHGVPDQWPAERDFTPDAENLDLAYDLAWSAVHSIAADRGSAALNRFYAAVDAGKTIDEAARTIGTTESALGKQWRADLKGLADR
ncbi:MAG: hypothetical protein QM650_05280 [Microlunatus sp.]